jgi:integrase
MALELIRPGGRKGNRFYLVRGTVDGRRIEVSAKTADETAARVFKNALETKLLTGGVPGAGAEVSFRRAAELYFAFKRLKPGDERRIQRLVDYVDPAGRKAVGKIVQADLVAAANALYPKAKPETKNRWAIKPGAAIVHYAAENRWYGWERIKKFQEGPVLTRAATDATAEALIAAIEARAIETGKFDKNAALFARKRTLLIYWLFRHWNRISDILRVDWTDIDLNAGLYRMYIGKTRVVREKPIDAEVLALLIAEPDKTGRLFPWTTRAHVYRWLRPLTRKAGIKFTPHMARHYGGTLLNRNGEGLKTIMGALDHSDAKSSLRYQDADQDVIREAMERGRKRRATGNRPERPGDAGETGSCKTQEVG